jgi:hypothetical protein
MSVRSITWLALDGSVWEVTEANPEPHCVVPSVAMMVADAARSELMLTDEDRQLLAGLKVGA